MKSLLKRIKLSHIVPLTVAVAAVATLATAAEQGHHGTDILHLSTQTGMTNHGVLTSASGTVDASSKTQGNADHQSLDIFARGLDKSTTYTVFALIGDETSPTQVTDFTSDSKGRGVVRLRNFGNGHQIVPLPTALDPVYDVHSVSIYNSSTQAVLTADLSNPDRLQYLVKRDLSTSNVTAVLHLESNTHHSQFKLSASGLSRTNDYLLVFNGGIVQTNSTDAHGRLHISSPMQVPTDILNLQSVALWDSTSNVVLSTTLP
jgi:hypothetical protein